MLHIMFHHTPHLFSFSQLQSQPTPSILIFSTQKPSHVSPLLLWKLITCGMSLATPPRVLLLCIRALLSPFLPCCRGLVCPLTHSTVQGKPVTINSIVCCHGRMEPSINHCHLRLCYLACLCPCPACHRLFIFVARVAVPCFGDQVGHCGLFYGGVWSWPGGFRCGGEAGMKGYSGRVGFNKGDKVILVVYFGPVCFCLGFYNLEGGNIIGGSE